jgi:transcription initiation factor IIE alpha subunit
MKEILRVIHDGGLLSKGDIANKVGIQESTLNSILSLLSSKGYLKTTDDATETPRGCIGCPISKECMQKPSAGTVYIVTEKGKNYLEKN